MSRLKKIGLIIFIGIIILCIIAGAGIYYVQRPVEATGETKMVFVEPGMTLSQVASRLQQDGLIRSTYWFKLVARFREVGSRIQVGRYHLATGLTTDGVLETLVSGKGGTERVTIPEGLTLREVAGLLMAKADIDSSEFMMLAQAPDFAVELGIEASTLEGYLFPDTYHFYRQMEPELVIREMTALFRQVLTQQDLEKVKQLGMTLHDVVALASIIEREAQLASERDIISGVFHNRLRIGRRLESCATVQYILGKPKAVLLDRDLQIPSPYNTYLHAGLPPGPICSPGAAALHAALYPASVPYLYFVARGDGSHIFSKSNREHVNAKNRIKRSQT